MIDDVRSLGPNQLGGARLELRNSASTSVALDGSWWPRTRDSAGELTALIRALEIRQAPVRLLMLNPHGWRDHPPESNCWAAACASTGSGCSTSPS
jgi:hypothetical protein